MFLDLDGSLLDFAAHPDAVEVTPAVRAVIARIHRILDGAFALLSGRPLAQIDALLDLPAIPGAGLHGAEIRERSGRRVAHAADTDTALLAGRARELVANLPDAIAEGIFIEDKGVALALHFRNAPAAADAIGTMAADLLHAAGPGHELQRGNHVVEIKPAGCDKGDALAWFMRTAPFAGRVPWMIGDDLTDEHAFARCNALGGVSVIVGTRRPTGARHALVDPAAVRAWLAALAGSLPDHGVPALDVP